MRRFRALILLLAIPAAYGQQGQQLVLGGQQGPTDAQIERCMKEENYSYMVCFRSLQTGGSNPCLDAKKAADNARKTFADDCKKASLGGNCEKYAQTCTDCQLVGSNDGPCDLRYDAISDLEDRVEQRRDERESRQFSQFAGSELYQEIDVLDGVDYIQVGLCPPVAAVHVKEAKQQSKDLRSEIKDLRGEIEEKNQDIIEINNKLTDAKAEYDEALAELDAKYQEKLKNLPEDVEAENQKLMDRRNQISRTISQRELDLGTKEIEYYEQVALIEKTCEDEADRELLKKKEALELARQKNGARKRTIKDQLRLAINGRVAENEAFRRRAIARCRVSDTKFKKPFIMITRRFNDTLARLKKEIIELQKEADSIGDQIRKNSQKYQRDNQELLQKWPEERARLLANYNGKIGACNGAGPGNQQVTFAQQLMATVMKSRNPRQMGSNMNCTGLQGQLVFAQMKNDQLERELVEKERQLTDWQYLQSAAVKAANGYSEDKINDAFVTSGGEYRSRLNAALDMCGCDTDGQKPGECSSLENQLNSFDSKATSSGGGSDH